MRLIGTAASGIRAEQVALDTLGNNMANLNTTGFKASEPDFAEALSSVLRPANTKQSGNQGAALSVGAGVLYNGIGTNFQQGVLTNSDRPLDLGIDGSGFFQVKTTDGSIGYTRAGAFQLDGTGQLTDSQGNLVQPSIVIPTGAAQISVHPDGTVTGIVTGAEKSFGQITLVGFQNPEGLLKNGGNLFFATANSGAPQVGQPGTTVGNQVLGTIRGKSLEQSNVNLTSSMTDLIEVQRAYQMNARLVSDGDQMWSIANTMRR